MAQPIHCDHGGCGLMADVLVSRLGDGDTTAWCFDHYIVVCQAVVSTVEAEREQRPAPPANDPLSQGVAQELERQETDAQASRRLDGAHPPEGAFPGTETVVPAGTSRSRRAYQARQRAKRDQAVPGSTTARKAAPGPSSESTEDSAAQDSAD